MLPVNVPLCGSRRQSPVEIAAVRKVEITLVLISRDIWNTLQEACDGRGKRRLKSRCRSAFVLQCHRLSEPKERDGMSVIALWIPGMCNGVSGELLIICRRRARARSSCIANGDVLAARRSTQCTVGELSLNSATCAPSSEGQTSSITIQRRRSPASSKSELLMVPFLFCVETRERVMSSGHCSRKTVGVTSRFSPTIIPPTP